MASRLLTKCRRLAAEQRAVEENGRYPFFVAIRACDGPTVHLGDRCCVMAGSSDYLGLTHHTHVVEQTRAAVARYGTSVAGSRLLNGTLELHEEFEARLARFVGYPAAALFPTGYQAQLGAVASLAGKEDEIFCDRRSHASLVDGCQLSRAALKRYKHGDVADLERLLERSIGSKSKLIVTDGVFSMDGDLAPLPAILECARAYGALALVDDSHGLGVIGSSGRGTSEVLGVQGKVDVLTGSLSKALASIGGFVAADRHIVDYLKHYARPFVFTGSLPASAVAAASAALDIVEREPERRTRLAQLTRRVVAGLSDLGFELGAATAPIVPVLVSDWEKTLTFFRALLDNGVYVNPVIPPAVPPGRSQLRVCLMATHTDQHVEQIIGAFKRVGRTLDEC
ncbi:MAG: aminotransferase class I/II-fold pyridoxal phosphate-dependent enzyme [Phycisphaerae bacterium]